MKTLIFTLSTILSLTISSFAQENNSFYLDKDGQKHLCGPIELAILENDTTFSKWYSESIEAYTPQLTATEWKKNLENTSVDIYLGTWCGDSKNWVPKFIKLWDELGLNRNQLKFIALYDDEKRYKQGPNGEEKGLNIHRVPTFIFKDKGEEIARIVEYPQNNLETDVAQIALGFPSLPAYKGANYLMNTFDDLGVEGVRENFKEVVNKVYRLQSRSSELNTLGYVYLRCGELEKALSTFYMNTLCYKYNPNVYDSYAEALEEKGNIEYAVKYYQKAIDINPKSENAIERLAELTKELKLKEIDKKN